MTSAWQKSVGKRLSEIRGDLPKLDFAGHLQVSPNTLRRWEDGTTPISTTALNQLAHEGWDLNWLLTGQGTPRPESGREDDLNIAIELADLALGIHSLSRAAYAGVVGQVAKAISQHVSYEAAKKLAEDLVEQRLEVTPPKRQNGARLNLR